MTNRISSQLRRVPMAVLAVGAIGVAGAGSATAAGVVLKKPNQIKNGVITGAKLRNGTVTEKKLSKTLRAQLRAAGVTAASGGSGAPGSNGANGAPGSSGANGRDGQTGAAGQQGAKGATGATGATGAAGAQGPAGPQGPAGQDGTAVAYAYVTEGGDVDGARSFRVNSANVTRTATGMYEFTGLGFTPKSVVVTPAFDAPGITGGPISLRSTTATATGFCADAQACVAANDGQPANTAFYVVFQ